MAAHGDGENPFFLVDWSKVSCFDKDLRAAFRNELMRDFGYVSDHNELEDASIYGHLVKLWRELDYGSNFMKICSPILTGSAAEGSSLARLYGNELEIEVDLMLIAGFIETSSNEKEIFEDVPDAPGFTYVKLSPAVKLLLESKDGLDFIVTRKEQPYLSGDVFKGTTLNLQCAKEAANTPYQVHGTRVVYRSVQQHLEGPSAQLRVSVEQKLPAEVAAILKKEEDNLLQLADLLLKIVDRIRSMNLKVVATELCSSAFAAAQLEKSAFLAIPVEMIKGLDRLKQLFTYYKDTCVIVVKLVEDLSKMLTSQPELLDAASNLSSIVAGISSVSDMALDNALKRIHFRHQGDGAADAHLDVFNAVNLACICEIAFPFFQKQAIGSWKLISRHIEAAVSCLERAKTELLSTFETNLQPTFSMLIDNVPCLYFPYWPTVASEYVKRQRKWPSDKVISTICKEGCFLVAKDSKQGFPNQTWRWSFSTAENYLAKLFSDKQRECYFIFKALFYQHLKFEFEQRSLPSYLAKTCMLHVCEDKPPQWWEENSAKYCVVFLLNFLYTGLRNEEIRNFFMTSCNILYGFPKELLLLAEERVSELLIQVGTSASTSFEAKQGLLDLFILDFEGSLIARKSLEVKEYVAVNNPVLETLHRMKHYMNRLSQSLQLCEEQTYFEWSFRYAINVQAQQFTQDMVTTLEKQSASDAMKVNAPVDQISRCHDIEKSRSLARVNTYENFRHGNKEQVDLHMSNATMYRILGSCVVREIATLLKRYCTQCHCCKAMIPCGIKRWKCSCGIASCGTCAELSLKVDSDHMHTLEVSEACYESCHITYGIREIVSEKPTVEEILRIAEIYKAASSEFQDVSRLIVPRRTNSIVWKIARPTNLSDFLFSLERFLDGYEVLAPLGLLCEVPYQDVEDSEHSESCKTLFEESCTVLGIVQPVEKVVDILSRYHPFHDGIANNSAVTGLQNIWGNVIYRQQISGMNYSLEGIAQVPWAALVKGMEISSPNSKVLEQLSKAQKSVEGHSNKCPAWFQKYLEELVSTGSYSREMLMKYWEDDEVVAMVSIVEDLKYLHTRLSLMEQLAQIMNEAWKDQ